MAVERKMTRGETIKQKMTRRILGVISRCARGRRPRRRGGVPRGDGGGMTEWLILFPMTRKSCRRRANDPEELQEEGQ
jgi:hypothetical protein